MSREDAVALTRALVRIDSRNPTLSPGAPGERDCAHALADVLESWGFAIELSDSAPGRPNLVARIGPHDSPALMLAGHLDTVGVESMSHDPFSADIRDGRLYGRGACDMKSGLAAMCVAARDAAREAASGATKQIIIAAVTDEEYESLGMRAILASGIRAERGIVTEPTRLAICPAHRGFVWMELEFRGRAAHGSRYDVGIDAIRHAGLVLAWIDELDSVTLPATSHPLLGRPSVHASTIAGGIGMSTYPDRCTLRVERRTIPGETENDAMREMQHAIDRVRREHADMDASVRLIAAQLPSDVSPDAGVVRALERGVMVEGLNTNIDGLSAWTDAALLNAAGISSVCFGPGDIALAHAAEEYVPLDEIDNATAVLTHVAFDWMTEKS